MGMLHSRPDHGEGLFRSQPAAAENSNCHEAGMVGAVGGSLLRGPRDGHRSLGIKESLLRRQPGGTDKGEPRKRPSVQEGTAAFIQVR